MQIRIAWSIIIKEGEILENYTKYRLKEIDELAPFLAGTDKIFVVACNKCFKEFETVDEPDCGEFVKMAEAQGKTVTGSVQVDFLCNKTQTEKKLKDLIPEGTESIFVVSCGLGVQTIASMVDLPVYAAANSLNYRGHHGMALTKKSCDACAQCYLNMTGGVCPSWIAPRAWSMASAAAPRTASAKWTPTRTAPGRRSTSASAGREGLPS